MVNKTTDNAGDTVKVTTHYQFDHGFDVHAELLRRKGNV